MTTEIKICGEKMKKLSSPNQMIIETTYPSFCSLNLLYTYKIKLVFYPFIFLHL